LKTNIQRPQNAAIKATGDNAGLILATVGCASALSLSLDHNNDDKEN
jgi:hypothetical protein